MSVNIKVTGGLNIEWVQIDPKVTGGLRNLLWFKFNEPTGAAGLRFWK